MEDADIIIRSIECLINSFMHRYNERPRYIKVPIWVLTELRNYAKTMMTNFNYNVEDLEQKEEFTIFGLKVCETITIQRLDEMEVF